MQTNDTVNPPHLGFETSVIKASEKFSAYLKETLKHIEIQLNIRTSTPYKKIVEIMDVSFSKYYQNMFETNAQIDNDSGYVSHNHESNSDSTLDTLNETARIIMGNSDVKTVYLCEDALLEKPDICTNAIDNINQPVRDDDTAKFCNSNEILQKSVSTEEERFSVLQDSDVSYISNTSDVISEIMPIVIRSQLPIVNYQNICDISNDSNIENNMNSLNVDSEHTTKMKCTSINDVGIRDLSRPLNGLNKDTNRNLHNNSVDSIFSFNLNNHTSVKNKTVVSNECIVNKKKLKTPKKSYKNSVNPNRSPDLFSDDDVEAKAQVVAVQPVLAEEKYRHKHDYRLLKRVQKSLSGVLPPPSFTTVHLTAMQILEKIEKNNHLFWWSENNFEGTFGCEVNGGDVSTEQIENKMSGGDNAVQFNGSLLVTSNSGKCLSKPWPSIMEERFHGLHYNRSKLSEEFETLCMKYGMRYVGSETQSTCTVIETTMSSPLKRKASKLRWGGVKSPGRRLSHLARRRITFSSANLQAASSSSGNSRQVMMDSKRLELLTRKRSPKKKTPRKSPRKSPRKRIRTPSSSSKKRLSLQLQMITDDRENSAACSSTLKASTTKRALFQSPEHSRPGTSLSKPLFPSTCGNSGLSPYKKRNNTKCALFSSPLKKSPFKFDNKRKRTDTEDFHPSKLPRSLSLQETNKSNESSTRLSLSKSEMNLNTTHMVELSAHHKKKLQWAVYEALRSQNIGINHPGFKSFACVLARVTRRFLPNLSASSPRPEGGTSQRMLRLAKQHAYAVTKGKTLDEILQDAEQNRLRKIKPNGYVSLEGAVKIDVSMARNTENVLRDKINIISNEKSQLGIGVRTVPAKSENKVDRVRKVINFDEDSHIGTSGVR